MRLAGTLRSSALALTLLANPAPATGAGVSLGLTPAVSEVAPGAVFDLDLTVTQAGAAFNGFDAVVGYDPAALTFIPRSPTTLQQGTLMTGACANTFHVFRAGVGSDTIACVLLCNGVSVTGPGQIYRLRFQAAGTPQVTRVRFLPGVQFYDAGAYLGLDAATEAVIGIGMPAAAPAPGPARLALSAAPNPARHATIFTAVVAAAGPLRVTVSDLQGRVVRRLEDLAPGPGLRTLSWDGCDSAGVLLPPGLYLARLESAGGSATTRIARLR